MFGINLNVVGAAAMAAFVAGGAGFLYARAGVSSEIDAAVVAARAEARQATERAINELADEADRARVHYRLCVDDRRGMRWSFKDNKCVEAETQP